MTEQGFPFRTLIEAGVPIGFGSDSPGYYPVDPLRDAVTAVGHVTAAGYRDAFKRMVPLGRLGQPEDVAGAVAYLASDAAAWVTGEVLHVDGGFLAGRALRPTSSRPA